MRQILIKQKTPHADAAPLTLGFATGIDLPHITAQDELDSVPGSGAGQDAGHG